MQTRLNPYIGFNGNAREAMEFYRSVFGGKLELHTFEEYNASDDPVDNDKIMHAMLETDSGIAIMGADTPQSMKYVSESNISISLSGDNEDELQDYFDKLSRDGTVTMPLMKAEWGDSFGMCNDKYGVTWLVNIAGKHTSIAE
jgi:PhnB protein